MHVGIVSGFSDLAQFIAASNREMRGDEPVERVAILFGRKVSIPERMTDDFDSICANAFPSLHHIVFSDAERGSDRDWNKSLDASAGLPDVFGSKVFTSSLHDHLHQELLLFLRPNEIVFFDNGQSSYADWPPSLLDRMARQGLPRVRRAYLSLSPSLPIPSYLSTVQNCLLQRHDFEDIFRDFRAASASRPRDLWLPSHVIVGTSLYRGGKIDWESERGLYLNLVRRLIAEGHQKILFKNHPRGADRPLLTSEDGVEILETLVPIEAYALPRQPGTVYSVSSSSLYFLGQHFGWKACKIAGPQVDRLDSSVRGLRGLAVHRPKYLSSIRVAPVTPGTRECQQSEPHPIPIGVLGFGYAGYRNFATQFDDTGIYDVNVGDNVQSLAVEGALEKIGVPKQRVVRVDRDDLPGLGCQKIAVVMNGVIDFRKFPLPDNIIPIYIGTHVTKATVERFSDHFKLFEPIGCRDTETCESFQRVGVRAFVSGCLSLTYGEPRSSVSNATPFLVYGSGSGSIPAGLVNAIPKDMLDACRFVYQRMPVASFPLDPAGREAVDRQAEALLKLYETSASVVVTPLHHAATPCLARGIPVIIARSEMGPRFSLLKDILPVYLPSEFETIDWSPKPPQISKLRAGLLEALRDKIRQIDELEINRA